MSQLQVPSPARPMSVAVTPSPPSSRRQPPQQRASHQIVSSGQDSEQQPQQPAYTDMYSHPAAIAFAAAHPRRTIPKFGPYLLLQTLGEGEFGKVKLGLHSQWGEEVAVKLIRKGNVENSAVRMSKVEREIEVLRTLKHPNIVRLYDVIETDKYIGIIIEYASGGELFDHILAHRYLRERDASKLFSQLISGVWYIHQKKIVHRDLKLENLLLDRHRNVIITDFGFANRFEHRADDLMQTSCGSPCYAAPELVISEGLYVGSAVDIWSCGVILYAMLAGYLPFDDDPANPDGDNINLLYKYIVNTPLSFPEYISEEARDLLKMMLVPDPRKRASLPAIMKHPWLAAYHVTPDPDVVEQGMSEAFGRTVEDLERTAMEQHQMKRLAYQRQMRAGAGQPVARAQTQAHHSSMQVPAPSRSRSEQPEFLYNSSTAGASGVGAEDDDPFGPPPGTAPPPRRAAEPLEEGEARGEPRPRAQDGEVTVGESPRKAKEVETQTPRKGKEKEDKFRHTVQIEYDERRGQRARTGSGGREQTPRSNAKTSTSPTRDRATPTRSPSGSVPIPSPAPTNGSEDVPMAATTTSPSPSVASITERREKRRRGSTSSTGQASAVKPLPPNPSHTSPPTTWKKVHSPTNSATNPAEMVHGAERPTAMDVFSEKEKEAQAAPEADAEKAEEVEKEGDKDKDGKKSRRNTFTGLTVMVNPINSIRNNMNTRRKEPSTATTSSPTTELMPPNVPAAPHSGNADKSFETRRGTMKASTSKAAKVMDWIRKGRDSLTVGGATTSVPSPAESNSSTVDDNEAASPVQVYVTTPTSASSPAATANLPTIVTKTLAGGRKPEATSPSQTTTTPTATTPSASGSFASRFRRSINVGSTTSKIQREVAPAPTAGGALRVHHGAVDQSTITTGQPPEVMRHVKEVLVSMGMEVQIESEYKYRCIRAKQRRAGKGTISGSTGPQGVAAFTMVGSAGSNGVDKRGLPMPSQSTFSGGGGMLRGLLMRRQSSQVSAYGPGSTSFDADESLNSSGILSAEPIAQADTVYGDPTEDAGDEVRFSVELTRLDRLNDTYSLDIRRLKGNLRSYKFLYDTLRKRADLQR